MTNEKKFRTEIPNIIDDLGLDPHERALYVHYKRACGAGDCEWVESVRITAQRTKMSIGQTSQARNRLVERGLIRTIRKGNDGTAVRVVNIWDLNTTFYSQEHKPDIDGWTVQQLKEWCEGVHNMNTLEDKASDSEHLNEPDVSSVHNVNTGVHNMNNKKEPIKNKVLSKDNTAANTALLPDTKYSQLLFEKLAKEFEARGRRPPVKFPSLACKRKFDARATYLNGSTATAIDRALEKGIMAVTGVTDFIAKWNPPPPTPEKPKEQQVIIDLVTGERTVL